MLLFAPFQQKGGFILKLIKGEMETQKFAATKKTVLTELIQVTKKFNSIIETVQFNQELERSSNSDQWDAQMTLHHIFLVNEYLIDKIKRIKSFAFEGLMNNNCNYSESDLYLPNTMLNIAQFQLKSHEDFSKNLHFTKESLHLKINRQIYQVHQIVKDFPTELANNFVDEFKLIPGIRLDFFQIIFLGLTHMKHHLEMLEKNQVLESLMQSNQSLNSSEKLVYH